MPLIISAPHALCKKKAERDCDRRSKSAAHMLKDVIVGITGGQCDVTTEVSTLYRPVYDANRPVSKLTQYRITLTRLTKRKVAEGETFVIDIHSFPPDSKHGYYKVYFLEIHNDSHTITSWTDTDRFNASRSISNVFGRYGGAIIRGSTKNDIMFTSMAEGAHTVLLEVNESRDVLSDEELRRFFTELYNTVLIKYC